MNAELKIKPEQFKGLANSESLRLLRGIAMGGRASSELQLLLDSQDLGGSDYQALAQTVAGVAIAEEAAQLTITFLREHARAMTRAVGSLVGIRTAALDLAERLENAFEIEGDLGELSYIELAHLAFNDPMTGLHNYRFYAMRLDDEIQRAERYRHQLSLIMLDIDHFKGFNDAHGHPAGDEALRQVSKMMLEECRDTDLVARYGGEEFSFILPETTKRMAQELAERVRRRIESSPIKLAGGDRHRVTVSLGVATFPRDSWTRDGLVESADQALYQAKKTGRNRVKVFVPETFAEFIYKPEAGKAPVTVSVVGNFNGWDDKTDSMYPQADGSWTTRVGLIPGTYEYKFVVDGEHWIRDPARAEVVSDGYWGENSIARVKSVGDFHVDR